MRSTMKSRTKLKQSLWRPRRRSSHLLFKDHKSVPLLAALI
jgi:hypothetical protein